MMQLKIAFPKIWLASTSVDFRFGIDGAKPNQEIYAQ